MRTTRHADRRWWSQAVKGLFVQVPAYRHRPRVEELEGRFAPATFDVGTEADLRAAVIASNTNGDDTNVINLTASITLSTTNSAGQENASAEGDLDFDNLNGTVVSKQYTINGAGFTIDANGIDRVAQIIGSDVGAQFVNVTLTGGVAIDSGTAGAVTGSEDSLGGGILNEGGNVTFTNATVDNNTALGADGANGAAGVGTTGAGAGAPGADGAGGKNARGGGLYSSSGTITLTGSTFTNNKAVGGDGGDGGTGASGSPGGDGGNGGQGGDAQGGAIYRAAGMLTVTDSSLGSNSALAGNGGNGGEGGVGVVSPTLTILGGSQEVIGDAGGTNYANPNGSIAGKGLPTTLGGWPTGAGFAPDPTFGNNTGISGYHSVGANLQLNQDALVTFTYFGRGDSSLSDKFYVDANGNGVLEPGELLFQGGVNGQGDTQTIALTAGLIPFVYVTGNGVEVANGDNKDHEGSPTFFLGVDPYEATGTFQTTGNNVFAGLTDLPGPGDHDHQDLGVRISASPKPANGGCGGNGGDGGNAEGGGIYTKGGQGAGPLTITGGSQEVIGDAGGTNFANPDGSIAGKGLPTTLGGWPTGAGLAPDPSFNNDLGISGYNSAGANLQLNQDALVTFTYFGRGDSTLSDKFYVDANRNGIPEASELLFQGGVNGQGDTKSIFLTAGVIPFIYITGNDVQVANGSNANHDTSPAFFLGVDPYEATGTFQTTGNSVFAGLTDLPGPGDHDFQDLGVRISAATLVITNSHLDNNSAVAGDGGNGGNGGQGATSDTLTITGGSQEVIGDAGGTNFANPNGSIAGKGLPTTLGGWPSGPGFAPDPTFGNNTGISGYNSAGANLQLNQDALVTFTYFGRGDSSLSDKFYVDANRNGILEPGELLFQGGVNGQGDTATISLTAGLIPFVYVTGNGVEVDNGSNANHDTSPAFFLGVDPYEATGTFQTAGNNVFAGLTDLPGPGDHDFQDLGVRISAPSGPANGGCGGNGGNGGNAEGGGIWAETTNGTISSSTMISNSATAGNGGSGGSGVANTGSTGGGPGGAGGDGGSAKGGAATLTTATLGLDQVTVSGNSATAGNGGGGGAGGGTGTGAGTGGGGGVGGGSQGGGLFAGVGSVLTVSSSTIDTNSASAGTGGAGAAGGTGGSGGAGADARGGGVYFAGNILTVSNSTISTNSVVGGTGGLGAGTSASGAAGLSRGGGLFLASGSADVHNSTVASNTSGDEGGGIRTEAGSNISLVSTIIGDNTSTNTAEDDFSNAGTLDPASIRNLVETASGHTLVNHVNGNLVGVDPMLGALADNGGPTRTHALLPGSPAINAGFNVDSLPFDQRGAGFPRKQGSQTDIGAYESAGAAPIIAVAAEVNGQQFVKIFDAATHTLLKKLLVFNNPAMSGVHVALGDVNGDHAPDIIVGAGSGHRPRVKVFDGVTFAKLGAFDAFNSDFQGGVFVAAGDINNDGKDDIVVGKGSGGGPRVRAFDFANSNSMLLNFLAYPSAFRGGVRVASGDVNFDGHDDVITGTGAGAPAQVNEFSGVDGSLIHTLNVGPAGYTGGVFVGSGDVNGDGFDDIIAGTKASTGASISVFKGDDGSLVRTIDAFPGSDGVGVRVAGADLTGDDRADVIAGRGPTTNSTVQTYDGSTGDLLDSFLAFGPTVFSGIFVDGF